jgi:superfamily II DNA helicase RecQ
MGRRCHQYLNGQNRIEFPFLNEQKGKVKPAKDSFFESNDRDIENRPLAVGGSRHLKTLPKEDCIDSDDLIDVAAEKDNCTVELTNLRNDLVAEYQARPNLVFTNIEIKKMVDKCPTTIPEFMDLLSIDDDKYEKFGSKFLSILKRYSRCIKTKSSHFAKSSAKPQNDTSSSKVKSIKRKKSTGSVANAPKLLVRSMPT